MAEKLKIPIQAVPDYFESAKKKGLIGACFGLAGLDPSHFFKQNGAKESGHQGVLFDLGKGVSKMVDQLDFSDGRLMMAFAGSIQTYAAFTELIPFKSVDQNNSLKVLTAFTKSILEGKPVCLPFVMCPDINFGQGKLNGGVSDNRKKEIGLLFKATGMLLKNQIKPEIKLIVGNDWFHPVVRKDKSDSSSCDQEAVLQNLDSIKEVIKPISDYCQVDLITNLPQFPDYRVKFQQAKQRLMHDDAWGKIAKSYQEKAVGKKSLYYQTLNAVQLNEVVIDDIALYVATGELLTSLSDVALAMESDPSSLTRFYLEKALPIGIMNLGDTYENY